MQMMKCSVKWLTLESALIKPYLRPELLPQILLSQTSDTQQARIEPELKSRLC